MLKLVSEKGYAGTRTRDIAQEAGITELTLFRHFGSKERLFEEVLRSCTFIPRLKNLMSELEELTAAYQDTACGDLQLPVEDRVIYNNFMAEMQGALSSYFQSLRKLGVLDQDMSASAASCMFLWVLFSYFRTVEQGDGGVKKKDVKEIVKIFSLGVLPRPTTNACSGTL